MWLKIIKSDDLIRVQDIEQLFSPFQPTIEGRSQAGEEEQPPEQYDKAELIFPSGEPLPRCWLDPEFQLH